jgi:hypothetical protein
MSKDKYYDDDTKDGEYLSADEVSDPTKNLPNIHVPGDVILKSAFLTAIKYRTVTSALKAYDAAFNELINIKDSQARFNEAAVEELRSIELLRDAETIHKADRNARRTRALQSEEKLEQVEHQAYLDRKLREMEKRNADIEHNAFMTGDAKTEPSEEDKELEESLLYKMGPLNVQEVADGIRAKYDLSKEQSDALDEEVRKVTKSGG